MSRINKALSMLQHGQWLSLLGKSLRFLFKIPYSLWFIKRVRAMTNQSVLPLINFMYDEGYNLITPAQIKSEITRLGEIVKNLEPRNILEIGTANGGTLFLFCKLANAQQANIVSLDLPWGQFGGCYPLWKIPLYKSFVNNQQKLHLLRADSHTVDSLEKVKQIFNGEMLDFLFIDGDHSYEGVKHDFIAYAPLVRSGGIIAMHDIAHHITPEHQVDKFWQEIKDNYNYEEITNNDGQPWGIGVIYKI